MPTNTVELRALMSARDSSTAWDLRCYVGEKLIQFLQQKYPQSLPRTRTEWMNFPAIQEETDGRAVRATRAAEHA